MSEIFAVLEVAEATKQLIACVAFLLLGALMIVLGLYSYISYRRGRESSYELTKARCVASMIGAMICLCGLGVVAIAV